jgi:hypothetical protein
MATTEAVTKLLSESELANELRKAVIASTVGTTIAWYDFSPLQRHHRSRLRRAVLSQFRPVMTDYTGRDISREHG